MIAPKKTPRLLYQLKITLMETHPPVWRRVLVHGSITLSGLHAVIQTAMGWHNAHMHQFIVGKVFYMSKGCCEDCEEEGVVDEKKVSLDGVLPNVKDKARYEYDFGDSWMHQITVEKILPLPEDYKHPTCVDGKQACPPDDCGGPFGYENFLEAISDPDHPEHDELKDWIGGEFDPDMFDIQSANLQLAKIPTR